MDRRTRPVALLLLVSRRPRLKSRSSGGVSLHSILRSMVLLHIYPTTYSLSLSNGDSMTDGEFLCEGNTQGLIVCRCIKIHILNLSDGSPYCAPPSDVIKWAIPRGVGMVDVEGLIITSSRLLLRLRFNLRSRWGWRICVWDWKSGDLVIIPWLE